MLGGATVRRMGSVFAALGFVAVVVGLPAAVNFRSGDGGMHSYAVGAGPRDAVMVTTPVRLSNTPDVLLEGGLVFDPDGGQSRAQGQTNAARLIAESPMIRVTALPSPNAGSGSSEEVLPHLLDQLAALNFDKLQVRRGTMILAAPDGSTQVLSDLTMEVDTNRKGTYTGSGQASYRGINLTFDATWTASPDGKSAPRVALKLTVKSTMLQASFDGRLNLGEGGLRLQGSAEVWVSKVRQLARWFGIAATSGSDLKDMHIKGSVDWGAAGMTFSRAAFSMDHNEATGALSLSFAGPLPLLDGTLAIQNLDLTSYVSSSLQTHASLWPLGLGSTTEEDRAPSLLTRFDADLRVSAAKVTLPYLQTGRGAATIALKNGRLLADIAELEFEGGAFGGRIAVDMNGRVPHYRLLGKLDSVDAGRSLSGVMQRNPLQGRANIAFDLSGHGQDALEVLGNLSGKASFALIDGGRLGLDLRALLYAAQRSEVKGWAAAGKGQTALEQLNARVQMRNGILTTEMLEAKSAGIAIVGHGRVNVLGRAIDMKLMFRNTTAERAVSAADTLLLMGHWAEPTIRFQNLAKRAASPH